MSATYHLAADPFGNFSLTVDAGTKTPSGQPIYRQGWKIETTADLDELKAEFADCARAMTLLTNINPATLAQPPAADPATPAA